MFNILFGINEYIEQIKRKVCLANHKIIIILFFFVCISFYRYLNGLLQNQLNMAREFIEVEMGQNARDHSISSLPISLTAEEMQAARERFRTLDKENKGHVTLNDLRRHFQVISNLQTNV